MKRLINCIISFICLVTYVQITSVFSFFVAQKLYPLFENLDPDNVFIVLIIHHICQALITILVIVLITKVLNVDFQCFGFNFNCFGYSLKAVLIFIVVWIIIQAGVGVLLITVYGTSPQFSFPVNTINFTGYYLFEILLSGTSEEILFRSLVITLMVFLWKNHFKNDKQLFSLVILASTAIFMIAHINFSLSPFQIIYYNILQQLTCLVSGLFYGYLFLKTKSIVGCMIAHNLLNGVVVIFQLLFVIVF
ncbi:CPBP family intramembrane metalloprotease [Paenibacillus sp. BR2-3]|uniref:CPBP family intramembrane glutamic endopeptidase n=1 Tax=Paenibacillus sp. BR2-3 TaxID=3048494 RepID=UPI003977984A